MCDTCEVADRIESYGVPADLLEQFAEKVADSEAESVTKQLTQTHDLMVATIITEQGGTELRLTGTKVQEISRKLSSGRLKLEGEETADRAQFVYTLTEDASVPEDQEDEFTALLRALFNE